MKQKAVKRSQTGFITLMGLVILAFIISLAGAYLTAGSKEMDVANLLMSADRARMAALAGVRLTAGLLVKDAIDAPTIDHLKENWFLVTENTSGTKTPYPLDSTNGVYFHVLVVDLSGRCKANATNEATTQSLMEMLPHAGVTNADWAIRMNSAVTSNFWTLSEYALLADIGNDRVTGLTPYGQDFRININTADVKDDVGGTDPPDLIQILLKRAGGTASSEANTYSRRLLRQRRGGLTASCDAAYNPPLKDNSPAYVASTTGAWLTMAQAWTTDACGSNPQAATESLINDAAVNWGRVNSEGFFIIKSTGWVVKDPGAGSCPDASAGCREAQYQVMRYVKRSTSGYQDCANREWYYETRDLPNPPYVSGNYDFENTFFIIDSNF